MRYYENNCDPRYPTFTVPPPTASAEEVFCDFGSGLPVSQEANGASQGLCEWQDGDGAVKWVLGSGTGTNWVGGPPTDSTSNSMEGG